MYFDSAIQAVPWLTNASWQTSVSFLCRTVLYYFVLMSGHTNIFCEQPKPEKDYFMFLFLTCSECLSASVHNDGLWSLCYWSESPPLGKYNSFRVLDFLDYKQQLYSGQSRQLSSRKHLKEHFGTFLSGSWVQFMWLLHSFAHCISIPG